MSTTKSALVRHAVRLEGRGDDVLLLAHGYGCDQSVWRHVRPALSDIAQTVTFDITGAGKSDLGHFDERGRHADLQGYASDLIDICDELGKSNVTFVGHSVSATIGLLAAGRRPGLFKQLVLIAPSPCYLNIGNYRGGFYKDQLDDLLEIMAHNFTNWAGIVAPIIMGHPGRADLHNELSESFCRWDEPLAKHFARLTFLTDARSTLNAIADKCVILQGTDDTIAPEFVGTYMADRLASSTLIRLKAQGHCPHVSAPTETAAVILAQLQAARRLRFHAA